MTPRSHRPTRSTRPAGRSRRFRGSRWLLALPLLAASCGGGATNRSANDPFVASFPDEGAGVPRPPGVPLPPPQGQRPPLWLPDAVDLGRIATFGSFPADVVAFEGTVFTVDADAVEHAGASILAIDATGSAPVPSTRFRDVLILPGTLVDSAGVPADPDAPIAFGPFVNDLRIVSERVGFALASAGGSDSAPTLSNLVVFDPSSGVITQVVNLARTFSTGGPLVDSSGVPVPGNAFVQAGAEGVEYVPLAAGGGRLFVAMSNFVVGPPSFGAVKYPGTVQVFDVDLASEAPVAPTPTHTLMTAGYNPGAVARWTASSGLERLLVTVAGTTGFDASFNLVATSDSSVEAYDPSTLALLGTFVLGRAGLATTRPALGYDEAGHAVGFYPSSVTGEVYLLRLDGLDTPTVDPTTVAVLRGPNNGIPIDPAAAGSPGGNVAGIALSPSGRTLVVSGFGDLFAFPTPKPGRLYAISLPADLVATPAFGPLYVPGTANFVTLPGRTLGALVLAPSAGGPDVYVAVGGTIDLATFLGSSSASIGTLSTFGAIR